MEIEVHALVAAVLFRVRRLDALVAEHGESVMLMRAIKKALDPDDILNPGKTVPL